VIDIVQTSRHWSNQLVISWISRLLTLSILIRRIMLVGTKRSARRITAIRYISQPRHDLGSTQTLHAWSFLFFSNMLFLPFVLLPFVPNSTAVIRMKIIHVLQDPTMSTIELITSIGRNLWKTKERDFLVWYFDNIKWYE
jgi:hypothetical protein